MIRKVIVSLAVGACCLIGRGESVLMVGDSHVAGNIYPQVVDSIISAWHPGVDFHHFGIVGAAFTTFNREENMERVLAFRPDVMIVHLGTNDSYGRTFNPEVFSFNMLRFYETVQAELPGCKMVFVSPFYNKRKQYGARKRKRRAYTWKLNDNTRVCADAIEDFCRSHANAFSIDNNASHGMDFINEGLIRRDNVHLTRAGYETLGRQVGSELLTIPALFRPSFVDDAEETLDFID